MQWRLNARSRCLAAVAAVAVVALLAGCSGSTISETSHSNSPTAAPSTSTASNPVSRIPLKCSQFANLVSLDQLLGNGILVSRFQQPYQLNSYVQAQAGALRCAWANSYEDYAENSTAYFIVTVTPDVTDAMWAAYASRLSADGNERNVYGAGSRSSCTGNAIGSRCRLDVRFGTTWLSMSIISTITGTDATAHAALAPLLKNAATLVKGITVTGPKWQDAVAAPLPGPGAFPLTDVQLATALGQPVTLQQVGPFTSEGPLWGAQTAVGDTWENISVASGEYGLTLEVLPAGAWAWSAVKHAAERQPVYTSVGGIGQGAISYTYTQSNPASSVVEGIAGHNLFIVFMTPSGASAPPASALARKAAKALAGAIGG